MLRTDGAPADRVLLMIAGCNACGKAGKRTPQFASLAQFALRPLRHVLAATVLCVGLADRASWPPAVSSELAELRASAPAGATWLEYSFEARTQGERLLQCFHLARPSLPLPITWVVRLRPDLCFCAPLPPLPGPSIEPAVHVRARVYAGPGLLSGWHFSARDVALGTDARLVAGKCPSPLREACFLPDDMLYYVPWRLAAAAFRAHACASLAHGGLIWGR